MVLYNRTRVSRVPNRIVIGMETISASELKSGWSRLRIDDKRIIWRHEQSDYSILLFISKWTIFTFLLRNMVWYMLTFIWDWIKYGLKFDYFKLLRVWFYMQSAVDALKHRTLCKNLMCRVGPKKWPTRILNDLVTYWPKMTKNDLIWLKMT